MKLFVLASAGLLAAATLVALPGCETVQSRVPANAQEVAMGTGNTDYKVAQDGTIYLLDKTWNKIVYTGQVKEGQLVQLDAFHDKVIIDGKTMVEQIPLGEGSQYEFLLDTSPTARGNTVVERRTVIEKEVHE